MAVPMQTGHCHQNRCYRVVLIHFLAGVSPATGTGARGSLPVTLESRQSATRGSSVSCSLQCRLCALTASYTHWWGQSLNYTRHTHSRRAQQPEYTEDSVHRCFHDWRDVVRAVQGCHVVLQTPLKGAPNQCPPNFYKIFL
jgi:hypothetical protein